MIRLKTNYINKLNPIIEYKITCINKPVVKLNKHITHNYLPNGNICFYEDNIDIQTNIPCCFILNYNIKHIDSIESDDEKN